MKQQKNQTKSNGASKLDEMMEAMRIEVVEAELKARYWKAQYELRHFTLEAEKLAADYTLYLEKERALQEQKMKAFREQMEANKEAMKHIVTADDLADNPELVEEDVRVGEVIELGPMVDPSGK